MHKGKKYWQEKVEQWSGSGLNMADFCRRLAISRKTFYRWRAKLKPSADIQCKNNPSTSSCSVAALGFQELKLAETTFNETSSAQQFIEINLPHGIIIKVPTCAAA